MGRSFESDYGMLLELGTDGLRARFEIPFGEHPESSAWYESLHLALDAFEAWLAVHPLACFVLVRREELSNCTEGCRWRSSMSRRSQLMIFSKDCVASTWHTPLTGTTRRGDLTSTCSRPGAIVIWMRDEYLSGSG